MSSKVLTASYVLNSAGVKAGVDDATAQFGRLETESDALGKSVDEKTSKLGSGFTALGNTLGSFGVPFSESLKKVGSNLDDAKSKGKGFGQVLSDVGGIALGTGAVGVAAFAGESVKLGLGFQSAVAQLAGAADIPVKKAKAIGDAFLDMGGKTIFSGTQMVQALTPVAGQLSTISGHALTTAQNVQFMAAAAVLAEASNSSLSSTTSALAGVMQSFQVPIKNVSGVTNELFTTSRLTGTSVSGLASTMDRLKSRLGVAAPSVKDLGTTLVDLAAHGVSGSRGLLVVNTAVTKLLSTTGTVSTATAKATDAYATKVSTAKAAVQKASEALANTEKNEGVAAQKSSLTAIAAAQAQSAAQIAAANAVASAQQAIAAKQAQMAAPGGDTVTNQSELQADQLRLSQAQEKQAQLTSSAQTKGALSALTAQGNQSKSAQTLTAAQQKLADAQAKLTGLQATGGASTNASVQAMQQLGLKVYDSAGKFVGMGSVIDQLQPKLKGMTQQQQLQALGSVFGTSANKALLDTVLAGAPAWDKAQKAVMAHNAAAQAAQKQNQTLGRQMDIVKTQVIDLGTKFGNFLIPKLEEVGKAIGKVITWFEKHKTAAKILAGVIGTVLAGAMAVFAVNTGTKMVKSIGTAMDSMGKLGKKVLDMIPSFGEAGGAEEAFAATSEETGEASSAAFGPVGLAIAAVAVVGYEVVKHWKTISKDIVKAWDDVFGFAKKIFGDLEDFFKKWGEDILLAFDPVVGIPLFLATHWNEVLSDAERIWGDIVGFFESIPSKIIGAFADAGSWLLNVGKDILGGLASGLSTGFDAVTGFVGSIGSKIVAVFSDAGSWLLNVGKDILGGMISGLSSGFGAVASFFTSIPGKVAGVFSDAGSWLLDAGKKIVGGLVTGFEYLTPVGLVIKFRNQILGALSDAGTWLLNAGKDVLNGLWAGMVAGWDAIGDVGKWVWSHIESGFTDAGKWLVTVGEDIVKGLAKGIVDGGKLVEKEVKHLGSDVVGWAKDAWHVFSPSQVFAEIGTNLVQGLAQGITNSKQLATAAMADVDVVTKLSADVVTFRQTMSTVAPAMSDAIAGVSGFGTALNAVEARLSSSSSGMGANLKVLMHNVGVDMAQGLIDGLSDSQNSINQTMDNIGQSLVNTAKSATGSHSPSTIFAGIGNDVMTGLQQGLTTGSAGAVDALTKAAHQLASVPFTAPAVTAAGDITGSGGVAPGAPAGNAATGPVTINLTSVVQVDGRQIGEVTWQYLLAKGLVNGSAGQLTFTTPT